jgi:hypothetical protein
MRRSRRMLTIPRYDARSNPFAHWPPLEIPDWVLWPPKWLHWRRNATPSGREERHPSGREERHPLGQSQAVERDEQG